MRSLRTNRTVDTTSTTPMIASIGRSRRGYGESVRCSISNPSRDLGPGFPGPVEVPVRPAAEQADESQQKNTRDQDEEHQVLRPALLRQPETGRSRRAPVEPRPGGQHDDQEAGEYDTAKEGAVDREGAYAQGRVGDD